MARLLRARGRDIALLVLIDSVLSRQSGIGADALDKIQWLVDVAEILERSRGQVAPSRGKYLEKDEGSGVWAWACSRPASPFTSFSLGDNSTDPSVREQSHRRSEDSQIPTPESHPRLSYHELQRLAVSQREHALLEHLKSLQIIPQETGLEVFRKQLHIVRANANSQRIYRPQEPYQGDLVLLCCQEKTYDPLSMWQPWVTGELSIQTVPGDHFSMMNEPSVQSLAAQLQRYLP
jgi:thioesterase domain-containing protein